MNTPDRILAAVDFSERSRVALGFAARLACQFDAELHVMHAQDPLLSAAAESRKMNLAAETEDELRRFVANTSPASRCRLLHYDVMIGPAARSIVHAAERERADVIVLSARGMSGAQNALIGSTTDGVLRRANVPVLVVPDHWAPARAEVHDLRGEGPVIVGVDFRIPSIEAAGHGAALAESLGTEMLLVHIVPALPVLERWRAHADAMLLERAASARQQLDQLAARIGMRVPTQTVVTAGHVASCLAEAAARHPHGIMAVGRSAHPHGYAPPGRTAYRTLTLSKLPVLMHVAR